MEHLAVDDNAQPGGSPVRPVLNTVDQKARGQAFFEDDHVETVLFSVFQQLFGKFFRLITSVVRHKGKIPNHFRAHDCRIIFCKAGKCGTGFFTFVHFVKICVHVQICKLCFLDRAAEIQGSGKFFSFAFQAAHLQPDRVFQRNVAIKHPADISDGHVEAPEEPDHFQAVDVFIGVFPVGISMIAFRRQQFLFFIVTDILGCNAGDLFGFFDRLHSKIPLFVFFIRLIAGIRSRGGLHFPFFSCEIFYIDAVNACPFQHFGTKFDACAGRHVFHDPGQRMDLFLLPGQFPDRTVAHDAAVGAGITACIVSGDDPVHAVHLKSDRRISSKSFRFPAFPCSVDIEGQLQAGPVGLDIISIIHRHNKHAVTVAQAEPDNIAGLNDVPEHVRIFNFPFI